MSVMSVPVCTCMLSGESVDVSVMSVPVCTCMLSGDSVVMSVLVSTLYVESIVC